MRIIYNVAEKSGREENSNSKGCLNFNKEDRSFSCDASDLDCMGVRTLETEFEVQVEETGNVKPFRLSYVKTDDEGELQYHLYVSKDGKHNFFIWND
jgi:hypothetical protein